MMTGEVEYGDKILKNPDLPSKLFPSLLLVLFLLLIYIVLSNLLVGLAVSDMSSIQKRSELLRLSRQVELMVQVEAFINNCFIPKWLKKYLKRTFSILGDKNNAEFILYPNKRLKFQDKLFLFITDIIGHRQFLVKFFEYFELHFIPPDRELSLPSEIIEEATQLAVFQHELGKRERLYLRRSQLAESVRKEKTRSSNSNLNGNTVTPHSNSFSHQWSKAYSSEKWTKDTNVESLVSSPQQGESTHQPTASMQAAFWRASFSQQSHGNQRKHQDNEDKEIDLNNEIRDLKEMITKLQLAVGNLSLKVPLAS